MGRDELSPNREPPAQATSDAELTEPAGDLSTSQRDREARLRDLLLLWEEGWHEGRDAPAEELCRDEPHLAPELARRIAALKAFGAARETAPRPPTPQGATATASFRDLRPLGRGGMGEVFSAVDDGCGRTVALKFVRADYAANPESQQQLLAEAELTSRLEHPGVIPVYGLGRDARGNPCYAMRLIRGISLADAVAEFHAIDRSETVAERRQERLARLWAQVRSVAASPTDPDLRDKVFRELLQRFVAVCQTIAYAHNRDVVHRDLKPGNIMLGGYGETLVLDWGLAKGAPVSVPAAWADGEELDTAPWSEPTASLGIKGTPAYMSPEQAHGSAGPLADVYGLGATFYTLLTGWPPFSGSLNAILQAKQTGDFSPPRARASNVPRPLEAICLKAMALRPDDRYATAADLAADVENWLADLPVAAHAESWTYRLGRWMRRHRAGVSAAAVALLVVAVVASLSAAIINAARRNEAQQRALAERRLDQVESSIALRLMEEGDFSRSMLAFAETLQSRTVDAATAEARRRRLVYLFRQLPRLVQVWRLDGPGVVGEFSPEGRWILTADESGAARIHDVESGMPIGLPMQHGARLTWATFSPDGRLVATTSEDRTARVWEAATGQPLTPPLIHEGRVTSAAFSADASLLATSSRDQTARLWRVRTGQPAFPPLQHAGFVNWVEFSPDGSLVVTATENQGAVVWRLEGESAMEVWNLPHDGAVHHARFSPDGAKILTSGAGVTVWDARTGRPLSAPLVSLGFVWHAQFSRDGGRFVTADGANKARIWDTQTGQPLGGLQFADWVRHAEFSPDGRFLAAAGEDGTAQVCFANTSATLTGPLRHAARVRSVRFSPNGRQLLTVGDDRLVRVWDLASIDEPTRRWTFDQPGHPAALAADGTCVAMDVPPLGRFSDHAEVRLWRAEEEVFRAVSLPHPEAVERLGFSPDSRTLYTGTKSGVLRFWDAVSAKPRSEGVPLGQPVRFAEFSRDGRFLLTVAETIGKPSVLQLWNATTGATATPSLTLAREISAASLSPDGSTIAYAYRGQPAEVRLRHVASGAETALPGEGPVQLLAFSPRGQVLAVTYESVVRLFALPEGRAAAPPLKHGRPIRFATFSPDGALLATGGDDGVASLWDAADGRLIGTPMRHGYKVIHAEFSPDAHMVATVADASSESRRIALLRLWDAHSGEPLTSFQYLFDFEQVRFRAGQNVLGVLRGSDLAEWNVEPLPSWSDGELLQLAQLYSGARSSHNFESEALSADELQQRWERLLQRHAADFAVPPNVIAAWHATAAEALLNTHPDAALGHISEIAARRTVNWWEALLRGLALAQLQRHDEAVTDLTWALEKGGERSLDARLARARAYRKSGQLELAQRDFTEAIDALPVIGDYYLERGRVAADLGDYESAAADLRRGLELREDCSAGDWFQACLLSLATGDRDGYRDLAAQMLDRFRQAPDAFTLQSTAWTCLLDPASRLDPSVILELAERAAETEPDNVRIMRTQGLAHYRRGDAESAAKLMQKALERMEGAGAGAEREANLRVNRPYCLFVLAMAQQRLGDLAGAKATFERAVQLVEQAPPDWQVALTLKLLQAEAREVLGTKEP